MRKEKNNPTTKVCVILLCAVMILCCVSGCGANMFQEIEEYTRVLHHCTEYEQQEQKSISLAYGACKEVHLPRGYEGRYYKYPYWEESGKASHVVMFEGNGDLPIAFEWIGDSTLGTYLHEIAALENINHIELTDSTGKARLFVAKERYEGDALDDAKEVTWQEFIRADVEIAKKGMPELLLKETGYEFLLEVRTQEGKGYAKIVVDTFEKTVTQMIYVENKTIYDAQRVESLLGSLQISDGKITQREHRVNVEVGEAIAFFAGEYFEGNPYELSQYEWEDAGRRWSQTGSFISKIRYGEKTFDLQVEVVDTMPPSFEIPELSGIVLEGQTIALDEYVKVKKIKDVSKPVMISYAGLEENIIVSKEICDENGFITIPVVVEDSVGNQSKGQTKLLFVERSEETTWIERIGWDTRVYWELVFAEYSQDESLSVEEACARVEQEWGLTQVRNGVILADAYKNSIFYGNASYENMEHFYDGFGYLSEELLNRFVEEGWTVHVIGDEIKNTVTGGISAGDTVYDEKMIRYSTASMQEVGTLPHEFGHFIDMKLAWPSQQPEFVAMYQTRILHRGIHVTEGYDIYATKDVDGIYDGYSYSDVREFFADSVACYLIEPQKLQDTYPEIYAYLDACVAQIESE